MKRIVPYLLAVLLLGIDQWSKAVVRSEMSLGQSIPVIPDIFHLTYIENTGVASGFFRTHRDLHRRQPRRARRACRLRMEGAKRFALAALRSRARCERRPRNIIDRASKASVTDMFDLRVWPIFNVADIAVCVGFACLVLYLLFDQGEKDGNPETHHTS